MIKETLTKLTTDGLQKGIDSLKEGKSLGESLKEVGTSFKENCFKELNNYLSPEGQESFEQASEKLTAVQEEMEFSPENFDEAEVVKEATGIIGGINNFAKEILSNLPEDLTQLKSVLETFTGVLDQLQEVQGKFTALGGKVDFLSLLNSDAHSLADLEKEVEEGTEE
ncbi:hypothetical protein ACYSNM_10795 [Myroides sp. LJL116]